MVKDKYSYPIEQYYDFIKDIVSEKEIDSIVCSSTATRDRVIGLYVRFRDMDKKDLDFIVNIFKIMSNMGLDAETVYLNIRKIVEKFEEDLEVKLLKLHKKRFNRFRVFTKLFTIRRSPHIYSCSEKYFKDKGVIA